MAAKKGQESTRDIAVRIEQIVVGLDDKIGKQDDRIGKLETGVEKLNNRNSTIDGEKAATKKMFKMFQWFVAALISIGGIIVGALWSKQ